MNLTTTAAPITGGNDAITGRGADNLLAAAGTFQTGDGITLLFSDAQSGLQTQVGYGDITGANVTFALTFNDKLYCLGGTRLFFSALTEPDVFNDPNAAGNGFIPLANQAGTPEDQVAIAPYQGKLAVFARRTVQIWALDPDPTKNAKQQVLPNIGTVAKLSVQSIGDFDILFLADSGFRSLRPRELSLNAVIADVGTPVDSLVQATLATLTDAQKATACGGVEPSANRYWCYIPAASGTGKIYVLSDFPSGQIAAWTTYTPSYNVAGTQTTFVPDKFWTQNGQVYVRSGNNIFIYGGTNGVTYDNCSVTWKTPYLDCGAPTARKHFTGADFALEGTWAVDFSGDYVGGTFHNFYNASVSSFAKGNIKLSGKHGTHFAMQATESSTGYARFSSAFMHFKGEDDKK